MQVVKKWEQKMAPNWKKNALLFFVQSKKIFEIHWAPFDHSKA